MVVVLLLPTLPVAFGAVPASSHAPISGRVDMAPVPSNAPASFVRPSVYPENLSTLTLFNNSLLPGIVQSARGAQPSLEVFDPVTDEIFVADFYSDILDVVSGETNQVVATVPVGEYPNSLAYDPVTNDIFYGLQEADLVGLINGTTLGIQRSVGIPFEPFAIAADPVSGNVFVVGWNSTANASLAEINGSSGVLVANSTFGALRFPEGGPNGFAYDPTNGYFYIDSIVGGLPGGTYGNLTVLDPADFTIVANLSLTFNPDTVLYVPSTGDLYIGNGSGNNLTIFDPSTDREIGTVALPSEPAILDFDAPQNEVFVAIEGNVSAVDVGTGSVVHTFPVLRVPDGLAFDPFDGDLYIADYVWNNVSIVNTTTYTVVGSALLGASPYDMTYDARDGDLYVDDLESVQLLVVNGSTDHVVGTVPLDTTPYGVAYDPTTNEVYADDYDAGNVSIINTTTDSIVGYLPSGSEPWGIAYDPVDGDLYVTNPGSNNTTVLDPVNRSVVGNLNFTVAPGAVAYDPVSHAMMFAEYDVDQVAVMNASTNRWIANTSVGSGPIALAIDPLTGRAFVGDELSDNVTVLGPRGQSLNLSIGTGLYPYGEAYNPVDGNVYVACYGTDSVSVINASASVGSGGYSTGSGPVAVGADPVTGVTFVSNYDSGSLELISAAPLVTLANVTFAESGLPGGTSWLVTFSGAGLVSVGTNVTFPTTNGTTDPFTVSPIAGYTVTPARGVVVVTSSAIFVTIEFRRSSGPVEYSVTFTESGLPGGQSWYVTLDGTERGGAAPSIVFLAENGTGFPFTVAPVAGYDAVPDRGMVNVTGRNVSVAIQFLAIPPPGEYLVSFSESDLPTATTWTVIFRGVSQSESSATIAYDAVNGTGYAFSVSTALSGWTATPTSGALNVSGAAVQENITFRAPPSTPEYIVNVSESGLPAGTNWSVTLAGGGGPYHASGPGSTLGFTVANGSYTMTVSAVTDYTANRTSASVEVDGKAVAVAIGFTENGNPGTVGPPLQNSASASDWLPYEVVAVALVIILVATIAVLFRRKGGSPKGPDGSG
jgi:YVTN family beta-propeller protein